MDSSNKTNASDLRQFADLYAHALELPTEDRLIWLKKLKVENFKAYEALAPILSDEKALSAFLEASPLAKIDIPVSKSSLLNVRELWILIPHYCGAYLVSSYAGALYPLMPFRDGTNSQEIITKAPFYLAFTITLCFFLTTFGLRSSRWAFRTSLFRNVATLTVWILFSFLVPSALEENLQSQPSLSKISMIGTLLFIGILMSLYSFLFDRLVRKPQSLSKESEFSTRLCLFCIWLLPLILGLNLVWLGFELYKTGISALFATTLFGVGFHWFLSLNSGLVSKRI